MSTLELELSEDILEKARQAAADDGITLDQFLANLIADGIGHRRAIMQLKERAARSNSETALSILSRAPDVPPEQGDEWPAKAG